MDGSRLTIGLPVIVLALMSGCMLSPWVAGRVAAPPSPAMEPVPGQPAERPATDPISSHVAPGTALTGQPDAQAMREVIAEVQQLQILDPAAEQQLLESLHSTPPDLWPLVAEQFRAAVAYRRESPQKERPAAKPELAGHGVPVWPQPPAERTLVRLGTSANQNVDPRPQASPGGQGTPGRVDESPTSQDAGPIPVAASEADHPKTQSPPPAKGDIRLPPDRQTMAGSDERVVAASYDTGPSSDWRRRVAEAAQALESEVSQRPQSAGELAQHARLRLLYLIAGRREDALRPIPAIAACWQDFWSKELYGLATLLDTELITEPTDRTAESQRHLSEAAARLGESSPLVVRNLAFVTEVQSYGAFKPFDKYEFVPGQKVLLYAEVENFKSQQTPKGFHTALRSSYQIFDSCGRRVADHEFNTNEEYCRNARRDFFIGYEFSLPTPIYPGKHVLQLTVADLNSQKIGQSSIEFTIKLPNDRGTRLAHD